MESAMLRQLYKCKKKLVRMFTIFDQIPRIFEVHTLSNVICHIPRHVTPSIVLVIDLVHKIIAQNYDVDDVLTL